MSTPAFVHPWTSLTQDPIRDGSNWHAYLGGVGDPVNYVDLWGLCASDSEAANFSNNKIVKFFSTMPVPPVAGQRVIQHTQQQYEAMGYSPDQAAKLSSEYNVASNTGTAVGSTVVIGAAVTLTYGPAIVTTFGAAGNRVVNAVKDKVNQAGNAIMRSTNGKFGGHSHNIPVKGIKGPLSRAHLNIRYGNKNYHIFNPLNSNNRFINFKKGQKITQWIWRTKK